ncbi:MAG TPA: SHOCT domain-containing protein [Burkholderiales bacterium]|nr:SHOCT domain-containing protein [Burkholderiales bacterium]
MKHRLIAPGAALAMALSATTLAHAQGYGFGPGMMGGYGLGGGYGWGFGMVGMLLWWVLLILGIVLLVKWLFRGAAGHGEREAGKRPLDILKERYARGEIDKKEFEEKKRDLGA